jgi:hypothetical protein
VTPLYAKLTGAVRSIVCDQAIVVLRRQAHRNTVTEKDLIC